MPIMPRPTASRMPVTMNGKAPGSTMLVHNCRSEQRNARPTSSSLRSTDFTP